MFILTSENPDFWIQTKGINAGKPLRNPIANCIGIKANPEILVPEFLYYTVLHLFQSQQFKKHLKGSVIPYITQQDIIVVLLKYFIAPCSI